ncbi:MAG TPA: hypothetical protein VMW91_12060 [Desulfosporosinus sp.]|nr:hypothetical protein [Desulfosporosinus sp.]
MEYREFSDRTVSDKEAILFQHIETILNHPYKREMPPRWFISFGALLYFLRDKKMGKKLRQDVDISVFEDAPVKNIIDSFTQYQFKVRTYMVDDVTNKPLHVVLKGYLDVDIFIWIKANGYYWHTYDHDMSGEKVPKQYVWKGTPCELMDGEVWKYHWDERVSPLNFPRLYGSLMDYWYPGWYVPDARFGQSRCEKIVKLKTCKNLKEHLK